MRRLLPLFFDVLFWVAFAIVNGAALAIAWAVTDSLFARGGAFVVAGILGFHFVYLHAFVVVLGLTKRLVQPTLEEGSTPIGPNRAYLAWGLNSVLQAIHLGSPFRPQIQLLFTLRWLHLRLFGMKVPLESIVGYGSELRQVELIELGEGSSIGIGATLACHLNAGAGLHRQARIRVGRRSLVGAYARLGPGVVVGDDVLVGTGTIVSEDVVLEDGARVGASCFLRRGVRIGARARIESGAVVSEDVPPGARVRAARGTIEEAVS